VLLCVRLSSGIEDLCYLMTIDPTYKFCNVAQAAHFAFRNFHFLDVNTYD